MNDWSEDNFLEQLMPSMRPETGAHPHPCPDAETLCSVAQAEASLWLCEAVAEHLLKCSACAGVHRRLLDFDQAKLPHREAEWRETGKRLDNWMAIFLRSQASAAKAVVQKRSARSVAPRNDLSKLVRWGKMRWALGVAAVFLLAATAYVMRHGSATLTQAPLVARVSPPAQQPGVAESERTPLEKSATNELQEPGPETANQSGHSEQTLPPSAKILTGKTTPPHPKAGITPRESIAPAPSLAKPAPGPEKAPPASPAQASQTPLSVPAPPPSKSGVPNSDSNPSAPPSSRRDISPAPSARETLARSSQAKPPSAVEQSPAEVPAAILLESGTRLWIVLKSVSHQLDGGFQFEGTLLLPVKQGGKVILDRDTEISGSGLQKGSRTSLLVSQIVVRGAHYLVAGKEAAINAQTPGTGSALKFNSGQVLEMWLQSASVYRRVPAGTGRPQSPQ